MTKKTRRQSQNTRYMQQVLLRLREYDLEEVRGLCQKYLMQKGRAPAIDADDDIELDDDEPTQAASDQPVTASDDEDDDLILLLRPPQEPEPEPEPPEDEDDFGEYPGDHHLEEDDGLDLDEILKE